MIAYMGVNAADCFVGVKAGPVTSPKPKTVAEMKAHILGLNDAANVVTRADLLRGSFTSNFIGGFRRITIIAIAEHGPFTNNQLNDLFAKIALGLVFSGQLDPDHSPEATIARRAELAGRITNRMLIASERNRPQRLLETVPPGDAQNPGNQNQESARGEASQANDKEYEEGTGWPRKF